MKFHFDPLECYAFLQTRDQNYVALKSFFTKFPEYDGRDFYITGESYAGVYIPMLAAKVMDDPTIKLKVKSPYYSLTALIHGIIWEYSYHCLCRLFQNFMNDNTIFYLTKHIKTVRMHTLLFMHVNALYKSYVFCRHMQ